MAFKPANKTIEEFEDYEGFVQKFQTRKKTTDDCYTPPAIYEAVLSFVREDVGIPSHLEIARPFYPGGDYESYDYTGKVVIDNPPFSILTKIVKFYQGRGIPFFLFAPKLTCLSGVKSRMENYTAVFLAASNSTLAYENGAKVSTAFVTNMLGDLKVWVSESLAEKIKAAIASNGKIIPKYSYPDEVFRATDSELCAELKIDRADTLPVDALDCQKPHKKEVFGKGLLLTSKAVKAVKAAKAAKAAKNADVTQWTLSEREKSMIAEREKANSEKVV
jgi:hypothetical protein